MFWLCAGCETSNRVGIAVCDVCATPQGAAMSIPITAVPPVAPPATKPRARSRAATARVPALRGTLVAVPRGAAPAPRPRARSPRRDTVVVAAQEAMTRFGRKVQQLWTRAVRELRRMLT